MEYKPLSSAELDLFLPEYKGKDYNLDPEICPPEYSASSNTLSTYINSPGIFKAVLVFIICLIVVLIFLTVVSIWAANITMLKN